MKKSTIWVLVVIILALFCLAWYAFSQSDIATSPNQSTGTATSTASGPTTVNYFCDAGTINASYGSGTLTLVISDRRTLTLSQGISGSGIRYEVGSGTGQDVVFESEGEDAFLMENNKTTYNNCVAGTETSSTSGMVNYTDGTNLFSFTYPALFNISGGDMGYTENWRSEATSTGLEFVVVTIPSSFQPKTNFADAKFTIGTSADPSAVNDCLTASNGNPTTISTTTINGVSFTKLSFGDVGAGNIYQITSYRTVRDNQCYALDYVVHSANLGNYSPDQGITAFDSAAVQNVLEGMARSFKFTSL